MLLGLAAGKIADLVFYRDGGEQRTRPRVIPKNPRTASQMAQRALIANVSATYRLLQSILKDSFSTRPSRMSGYNAFAKYAIPMSPYTSRQQSLAASVIPAPYIVSKGTIAPLDYTMGDIEDQPVLVLSVSSQGESPINRGIVSRNIIAQYPWLQDGDELTFVGIVYELEDDPSLSGVFRAIPKVQSFLLDTTDEDPIEGVSLIPRSGSLSWGFADEGAIAAAALIVSRVDEGGSLETSLSSLVLSELASELYNQYRSDAAKNAAISSYGVGSESPLR